MVRVTREFIKTFHYWDIVLNFGSIHNRAILTDITQCGNNPGEEWDQIIRLCCDLYDQEIDFDLYCDGKKFEIMEVLNGNWELV